MENKTAYSVFTYGEIISRIIAATAPLEGPSYYSVDIRLEMGNTFEPPIITVELKDKMQRPHSVIFGWRIDSDTKVGALLAGLSDLRDCVGEILEAEARKKRYDGRRELRVERGGVKVTLPQLDLFTQMGITDEGTMKQVDDLTEVSKPKRRAYRRIGCRMRDDMITSAQKVGREQGYCQRSDIERTLRRNNPSVSREEIREAVNNAVASLGLTCITYDSYRYYRRSDRQRIIEESLKNIPEGRE